MRIRFISDLHCYLNMDTAPTEFIDIMKKKEPADVTLIAGDASACLEEMQALLNNYFPDEKVIFVNGNHCVYFRPGKPMEDLIQEYKDTFNGLWKFLENDYIWLNDNIAVIGCTGWTDFMCGHQTKAEYIKDINKEKEFRKNFKPDFIETDSDFDRLNSPAYWTPELPEDPAADYDERLMGNKKRYRDFQMRNAWRGMNDYNYGYVKYRKSMRKMVPKDTYKWHKKSMKEIKRCYNEIVAKNPNATIILMTHHPFVKQCIANKYKDSALNSSFVSDHNKWLRQFPNIKYLHCGHVHQRFFKKIGNKELICNPMGYLWYYENIQDIPFNINYIKEL